MLGATAGRTTLLGEGLQHQDGHSLLLASAFPTIEAYDPAFAYEVSAIVQHGLQRMWADEEDVIFYLTLYNENQVMQPMPDGFADGVRSEEHTSELQSLMRISYAVFCLKKNKQTKRQQLST